MTTTVTMTPQETLAQAFSALSTANTDLAKRQKDLSAAQKRVEQATVLQQAAQLELKNAQARLQVLSASTDLAGPEAAELTGKLTQLQNERSAVSAELRTAQAATTLLDELSKFAAGMQNWLQQAKRAAATIHDKAVNSSAKNGADGVDKSLEALETLASKLQAPITQISEAAPTPARLAELQAEQRRLEKEITDTEANLRAADQRIDPDLMREATLEAAQAQQANDQAPGAVTRAQAALARATEAAARAKASVQAAQNDITSVEALFVDRIVVSPPNSAGIATAHAVYKIPLPDGYTLRWQAGDADVEPETGDLVHIDTTTLPVGQTPVVATIEAIPSTS